MTRSLTLATAIAASFAIPTFANAESYTREGNQKIEVTEKGGKLYCTRVADGYEMCHGMASKGNGTWGGKGMKHPDMPRWMSFNGTVVIGADRLKITGCALGICDTENWTRD